MPAQLGMQQGIACQRNQYIGVVLAFSSSSCPVDDEVHMVFDCEAFENPNVDKVLYALQGYNGLFLLITVAPLLVASHCCV